MIQEWIKDLVESQHPKEILVNGKFYDVILSPAKGDIVIFKPFHYGEGYQIGEIYNVEIIEGRYWGDCGLSNFWYWYRLDENGLRLQKEHGYGNFFKEKNNKF